MHKKGSHALPEERCCRSHHMQDKANMPAVVPSDVERRISRIGRHAWLAPERIAKAVRQCEDIRPSNAAGHLYEFSARVRGTRLSTPASGCVRPAKMPLQ